MNMKETEVTRTHSSLWTTGVVLVGVGSIVTAGALIQSQWRLQMGFSIIAAVLLVLGVIALAHNALLPLQLAGVERIVGESVARQLVDRMEVAKEFGHLGLTEVHADCTAFDYGPIITESHRLVVVVNDGRTWASVHRDRLRRRFTDPSKETTFIVIHPDSPMVEVLARKGSKTPDVIKSRIRDTVQLLEDIRTEETSLEILGHFLFNSNALVIGDEEAIVTPYFLSRGGRTVPAFKYRDVGSSCYFQDIMRDIERLRMDAKDIGSRNSLSSDVVRIRQ